MASKAETSTTDQAGEAGTQEFTHRIAGTPERGFCRAGRHWPHEGADVNRSEFSDEQWAALEAEPHIVITAL